MKTIKFIHTADIHLDMPFTSLNTFGSASVERRQEQRILFKKIIQTAIDKEVDMLLISGDLFEHEYASKGSIIFLNECFSSIPDIRVFISPGNHDPEIRNSYYSFFEWVPNVHIFKEPIEEITVEELQTSIYGTCFKDFHMYESPLKGFNVSNKSGTNILVSHGALDTTGGPDGYHRIYSEDLRNAGFDYIALGHIHKYMPELSGGRAFYPGSPVSLGFDEQGRHGVIYGALTGKRLEYEFIQIDTREYVSVRIDISGCKTAGQAASEIISSASELLKPNNYYHLIITGTVEADVIQEIEHIKKAVQSEIKGIMLIPDFVLSSGCDLQDISMGNDLRSVFARKIITCMRDSDDEMEKRRLEKILYIGLNAVDGKKVKYL